MTALNGQAVAIGPSMLVHYTCGNMTMEAFAVGLRGMLGSGVGTSFVKDETGLQGKWNFDVRWSLRFNVTTEGESVTASEAIEKQLGLKLEPRAVATPVLIVDSVNGDPSPNPSGTADALPPIPPPAAFEVADIRPTDPDFRGASFRVQNGRFTVEGMPMMFLVSRGLDAQNNNQIAGLPADFNALRFNINAKLPADVDPDLDIVSMGPLLRSLYRPFPHEVSHGRAAADSLYAHRGEAKDEEGRPWIAHRMQDNSWAAGVAKRDGDYDVPEHVHGRTRDAVAQHLATDRVACGGRTGLEGSWDFNLTFSRLAGMNMGGGRGGESAVSGGQAGVASDPDGGVTIFDAVEKQLGLKLEAGKRPMPVYVIDHIELKPTEN